MKDQVTNQILLHVKLVNGLLHVTLVNELYQLNLSTPKQEVLQIDHLTPSLWYSRLAHCSLAITFALSSSNKISFSNLKFYLCSHCCKAKAHKLLFYPSTFVATVPLQVISMNL
jgi:hypothetical protein